MPVRSANAKWDGSLKEGKGTMRFQSGAYEGNYSFVSRFEEGEGTNPEELLAAAHAGCYSMAFSAELGRADYTPESVSTKANVHLEKTDVGFTITKVHLDMEASIPNITDEAFQEIAEKAKKGCPVSRLFSSAEITLDAKLTQSA